MEYVFNKKFSCDLQQKAYEDEMRHKYPEKYQEWEEKVKNVREGLYEAQDLDNLDKLFLISGINISQQNNISLNKKTNNRNYDYESYSDDFDDYLLECDPESYCRNRALSRRPDWLDSSDITEEEYWDTVDFD